MATAKVTIQGTTPLICNRFHGAAQISVTETKTTSMIGSKGTPLEQAEKKLYPSIASNGKIIPVIPSPNLFRSFIDAGKFHKNGRSKMTTQKTSLIPAVCSIEGIKNGAELPIKHKEPWVVDTRAVRIPATGGRILAHRPMFNDWALSFLLEYDDAEISENMMRQIVDTAGKKIGLGDFRPDCKGPYGKFVVKSWS